MPRATDKSEPAPAPLPSYLNDDQILQLLRPLNHTRVGKDGKGFSHLEAYDVRAHMIRIFGFARWDSEILQMVPIFEEPTKTKAGKDAWDVAYRAQCQLTIKAPDGTVLARYTEWAAGDSTQPARADAHDQAIKTAESQALKRCATNLGDQYGLSLYNGGSLRPLVIRTLNGPALASSEGGAQAVDADLPELRQEGTNTPLANREVSSLPEPVRKAIAAPPEPTPAPEEAPEEVHDAEVVEDDAVSTVTEMFPGATMEDHELPDDPEVEGVARIGAMVTRARQLPRDERLQVLKDALELSIAQGLRQHRLPNGQTVGAALMREVSEAKEAGQAS